MHRQRQVTLPSDLPLNPAVTDDLCEDFISKLQVCNPILLASHINKKDIFTRTNRIRTDDLFFRISYLSFAVSISWKVLPFACSSAQHNSASTFASMSSASRSTLPRRPGTDYRGPFRSYSDTDQLS